MAGTANSPLRLVVVAVGFWGKVPDILGFGCTRRLVVGGTTVRVVVEGLIAVLGANLDMLPFVFG